MGSIFDVWTTDFGEISVINQLLYLILERSWMIGHYPSSRQNQTTCFICTERIMGSKWVAQKNSCLDDPLLIHTPAWRKTNRADFETRVGWRLYCRSYSMCILSVLYGPHIAWEKMCFIFHIFAISTIHDLGTSIKPRIFRRGSPWSPYRRI